ncbi:unnamed protein product [Cladocopium goreaui]|uniref:Kinesin light chain n=1 Tax=Cladocopium goreaui TaxID=2562237 RepID=A0A9P1G0I0_9DINO|nr:unnamed protein product [Cladocopium goreaui]
MALRQEAEEADQLLWADDPAADATRTTEVWGFSTERWADDDESDDEASSLFEVHWAHIPVEAVAFEAEDELDSAFPATQVFKTAMCKFWQIGNCIYGENCNFVHGEEEKQPLYKAKLCKYFQRGHCARGANCTFAHGVEEVQVGRAAWAPRTPENSAWYEPEMYFGRWENQSTSQRCILALGEPEYEPEMYFGRWENQSYFPSSDEDWQTFAIYQLITDRTLGALGATRNWECATALLRFLGRLSNMGRRRSRSASYSYDYSDSRSPSRDRRRRRRRSRSRGKRGKRMSTVDRFIKENELNESAAARLRGATKEVRDACIDQGWNVIENARNASAVVISRIKKIEDGKKNKRSRSRSRQRSPPPKRLEYSTELRGTGYPTLSLLEGMSLEMETGTAHPVVLTTIPVALTASSHLVQVVWREEAYGEKQEPQPKPKPQLSQLPQRNRAYAEHQAVVSRVARGQLAPWVPQVDAEHRIFQRIWSFKEVLAHAAKNGFQAYEFGIPRPVHDQEGAAGAKRALREKWTLVQNHVHRSHARPAQFLRNASILFGLPGGLNSYTTPAFATGFGYHFDPSDAIILQVEGNKTWELCARRLTNSFSFANLTYNQVPAGDPDVKTCSTVVLQEGDALYLPIGQIHHARTSDHRSIHLTMSLNRQFCSSAAVLLNVAEQINPSKEVGFAQMNFVSWVHGVATEGDLAFLHDVPRAFRCSTRGGKGRKPHIGCASTFLNRRLVPPVKEVALPMDMLKACVEDLQIIIDRLSAHRRSQEDVLSMAVRVAGKEEPVMGKLRPKQVLQGIRSLLAPEPCNRTMVAWQHLLARQHFEYLQTSLEEPETQNEPESCQDASDDTDVLDVLEGLDLDNLFVDVNEEEEVETLTGIGPWSGTPAPFTWDPGERPQEHRGEGWPCCSFASSVLEIGCANGTALPVQPADEHRVLITTYATEHVHSFARYTLPLNAHWAKRFNHSFVIDTRARATGGIDVKNAKVMVKKFWVDHPQITEPWLLWIGADAAIVDFGADVLRQLLRATDSHVQVLITRDPHGRAGNSMSLFNADVILIRRSPWSSKFLQRWWDDPRMQQGLTDQEVLELLYQEDVMTCRSKGSLQLLPPMTLNSDSLSIVAAAPRTQPVVHLGGHGDTVRAQFFREALALQRQDGLHRDSLKLQDIYVESLRQAIKNPEGTSSGHVHDSVSAGHFQRLARQLEAKGRTAEAVDVHRAALRHATQNFGPKNHQTIMAQVALGSALRATDMTEASAVLKRSCRKLRGRDRFTCFNNLALALDSLDHHVEAEVYFRKAHVGMVKGHDGHDSLGTANVAANWARQLQRHNRHAEAAALYHSAFTTRRAALGVAHPETLEVQASWAASLLSLNRLAEAEEVLQEALPHHHQLSAAAAQAHSTLGQALRLQGKLSEALEHFRFAYQIFSDQRGNHAESNVFAAASNLASMLHDAKRWEEAEQMFRVAIDGLEQTLGKQHANSQAARVNYESFLKDMAAVQRREQLPTASAKCSTATMSDGKILQCIAAVRVMSNGSYGTCQGRTSRDSNGSKEPHAKLMVHGPIFVENPDGSITEAVPSDAKQSRPKSDRDRRRESADDSDSSGTGSAAGISMSQEAGNAQFSPALYNVEKQF